MISPHYYRDSCVGPGQFDRRELDKKHLHLFFLFSTMKSPHLSSDTVSLVGMLESMEMAEAESPLYRAGESGGRDGASGSTCSSTTGRNSRSGSIVPTSAMQVGGSIVKNVGASRVSMLPSRLYDVDADKEVDMSAYKKPPVKPVAFENVKATYAVDERSKGQKKYHAGILSSDSEKFSSICRHIIGKTRAFCMEIDCATKHKGK